MRNSQNYFWLWPMKRKMSPSSVAPPVVRNCNRTGTVFPTLNSSFLDCHLHLLEFAFEYVTCTFPMRGNFCHNPQVPGKLTLLAHLLMSDIAPPLVLSACSQFGFNIHTQTSNLCMSNRLSCIICAHLYRCSYVQITEFILL